MKVKVGDSRFDRKAVEAFTQELSQKPWKFTKHGVDRLKETYGKRLEKVLLLLRDTPLDSGSVFEYYEENSKVEKACYEVFLDEQEAVHFSLSADKSLVTVWPVYYVANESGEKRLVLTK